MSKSTPQLFRFRLTVAVLGLALISSFPARAAFNYQQPSGPVAASYDSPPYNPVQAAGDTEPQELVGRLSLIQGEVSFQQHGQNNWIAANLNYPVVSGDAVATGPRSRAEIQAGAIALRLDGNSAAGFDELDDGGVRAEVSQGQGAFYVAVINPGQTFQINTPHETIDILLPGTYRVQPGAGDGPDTIAVIAGQARVNGASTPFMLGAGQVARVGPQIPKGAQVGNLSLTNFDRWNIAYNNAANPQAVANYVSSDMTGYQDLARYGEWQSDPEYGNVWIPAAVQAGWEPYRYGHWVWVSPWGWTWIDDAPWGFAPFHYGRWVYWHNRWAWTPGPNLHPVYAPALVAFGGSVGGISFFLDIHHRPSNWFPLGPHDEYRPGFPVGADYARHVNGDGHFGSRAHGDDFDNRHFAVRADTHNFSAPHPAVVTPHEEPDMRQNNGRPGHAPSRAGWHDDNDRGGDQHRNNIAPAIAPSAPAAPLAPAVSAPRPSDVDSRKNHDQNPNAAGWHRDRNAGPKTGGTQVPAATLAPQAAPHVAAPVAPAAPHVEQRPAQPRGNPHPELARPGPARQEQHQEQRHEQPQEQHEQAQPAADHSRDDHGHDVER